MEVSPTLFNCADLSCEGTQAFLTLVGLNITRVTVAVTNDGIGLALSVVPELAPSHYRGLSRSLRPISSDLVCLRDAGSKPAPHRWPSCPNVD